MIICGCSGQESAPASDAQTKVPPGLTPVASNPASKETEQNEVEFEPVEIVSATSALLSEYRTTRTNANNQLQNIGTNAPNSDL